MTFLLACCYRKYLLEVAGIAKKIGYCEAITFYVFLCGEKKKYMFFKGQKNAKCFKGPNFHFSDNKVEPIRLEMQKIVFLSSPVIAKKPCFLASCVGACKTLMPSI